MNRSLAIAGALGAGVIVVAAVLWQVRHRAGAPPDDVRVPVQGGDAGGIARAEPASEHFDPASLAQAAAAALAEPGFAALIVMRHEHIVLERYASGTAADTVVDSGAFAAGVLGLLVGVAAHDDFLPRTEVSGFRPDRLRAAIETAAHTPYADYLSRKLWRPLNAAPAWIALARPGAPAPVECCLHARVLDWMRVAGVLVGDGRFEGTDVAPAGWVARMMRPVSADGHLGFGVELASAARGSEPFVLDNTFFLRGPAHWRLWMVPGMQLAVLFGAQASAQSSDTASDAWDETRIANLVCRALDDQPAPTGASSLLQRLVPGH